MRRINSSPIVLLYHGIDDLDSARDPENLFVPVDAFEGQLSHLKRAGYHFLSEDEYIDWLNGRPLERQSVFITFDDGYVSVLEHAAPLLTKYGAAAVCFVCPGLLGGRSNWMPEVSWHELMDVGQLSELLDMGISLGVHGHDHTAMDTLPIVELERHTRGAARELEESVGVVARSFAYPYGTHSALSRQAVSSVFEAAFAIYDAAGRWALPRVDINSVDTPRSFALKLSSLYPTARRVLSLAPPLRRTVHTLVGHARR